MCDVRCCCFTAPAAPSTLRCDSRRSIRDWFASPPPSFSKPCKKCGRMHTFFCSSPSQEKKRLPVARRQLLIASHYEMGTSWSEFCFVCFCFLFVFFCRWTRSESVTVLKDDNILSRSDPHPSAHHKAIALDEHWKRNIDLKTKFCRIATTTTK